MQIFFIIVAGGKGKRFGFQKNKLLYKYKNKYLIEYTLEKFEKVKEIDSIILVANKEDLKDFIKIAKSRYKKLKAVIKGGKERGYSVWNGLKWIKRKVKNLKETIIGIHDGARINVSPLLIKRTIKAGIKYGGVVPGINPVDTVRLGDKNSYGISLPDRSRVYLIQTPQVFKGELIYNAYKKNKDNLEKFTDDASLLEKEGFKIKIIKGEKENIKITYKQDLSYILF